MPSELKLRIESEVKDAMRARDKARVGALRLVMSEIKRVEVDERKELSDGDVLAILDKMTKQRRDSLSQYQDAGRQDLAEQEQFELNILQAYMPEQLGADELRTLVAKVIADTGAESMKDMGKVMGALRPQVQGRADMAEVGELVKASLG